MRGKTIAPEVKDQIINRIKNDGVTVTQAAKDHGISDGTIYSWIAKRVEGQPTIAENIKLKRENEQLLKLVGEITLKLSETQTYSSLSVLNMSTTSGYPISPICRFKARWYMWQLS